MKRFFILLSLALVALGTDAYAQVSIDEVSTAEREFDNELKGKDVDAAYFSEANYRAERRALRKERNLLDFTANIQGSLTAFSESWQASGDNAMTIIANLNFKHIYTKDRFSLTNTFSGKFGYNNMKTDIGDGRPRGIWFKNVDEVVISTAPQWAMHRNWTYGANIKFRTQFAAGYAQRGDEQNGIARVSNFMAPGYLDASVGFTYVVPSEKFPLKINLAPIAMSATYVSDAGVYYDSAALVNKDKVYGVPFGMRSKYEGGLSVQLDFDRTWGKNGWLRYRTTAYSFYGWITDLSSMANFEPTDTQLSYEHVAPTIRWENTIDIKATKYISTQIYFQLYYNKAEYDKLQLSSMLSVGLTYTFKNK